MTKEESEDQIFPPSEITRVAVAVVRKGPYVLVGRRGNDGPLPGLAEFPGGKCLPDESPQQCAVRECREETGLTVAVYQQMEEVEHAYPHGRLRITFFLCEPLADSEPLPPFQWIPISDLASLPFPEANRLLLDKLLQQTDP